MEAIWTCCCLAALAAGPEVGPAPESSALAHNANFVVNAPDRQLAQDVLRRAETLRRELAIEWLGEALPPSVGSTLIRVKLSDQEDVGLAWVAQRADRLNHIVWLTTSRERAVSSTLAHEMTHVVLATQYPGQLPPWFDEGAASLADDGERRETRREILAWFARTGNWPAVATLLDTAKIDHTDQRAYAVSSSLVEMLLARGDRATLVRFALAGKRQGWAVALREYYGIASLNELQSQWQAQVLAETRTPIRTVAGPRR